jgi:predicted Zn-dependent peptidase
VLAVTPQDVQKVAQKYLTDESRVAITVLPEGEK